MMQIGSSWWLLIPCAVVALGGALLAYRYSAQRPPMPWRVVLPALRTLALFLCLALLLRPVWTRYATVQQPPILAVLADESLSLGRHDSLLQSVLGMLSQVRAQTQLYGFSGTARALPAAESLRVTGIRTDIAAALTSVQTNLAEDNVRAMLLISDGRYNAGRNPLYAADASAIPVHTIAIGDTTEQRDLQVRQMITSMTGYAGTEMPVEVSVMAHGYEGEPIAVTLLYDGNRVATTRATLPADGIVLGLPLTFVPPAAGLFPLTASVTRLQGEVTHANNEAVTSVKILDRRQRALLVAGGPHPDLSNMRALLLQDQERQLVTRIQKDDNIFYEGVLPDSLGTFDLIILAGYPGPEANLEDIRRIGGSHTRILFVLSQRTNLDLLREAFVDVLPVLPTQSRPLFGEASFELTLEGRTHAALQDLPAFSSLQLPPLLFTASRWQSSPDARVLAEASVGGVNVKEPLLVVRSRNGIRTAALLGSGTWRWNNLPEDLAAGESWWPTLFDNLVHWLLAPENERRVRIAPVQQSFAGNESVRFAGQVFDESMQGVDQAAVVIEVVAADGTRYPHTMEGLGSGRYAIDIGTLPEGTYQYESRATRDDATLGADAGTFAVGAFMLEFRETTADVPLMRQIAARSGGAYLQAEQPQDLARILLEDSTFAALTTTQTREQALWQWPVIMVVVLCLLTAEWVLRKRAGLS